MTISQKANLNYGRAVGTQYSYDDQSDLLVYVSGGALDGSGNIDGANLSCERYNAATEAWTLIADAPQYHLNGVGHVSHGSDVYTFWGGSVYDGTGLIFEGTNQGYSYNPFSDTWRTDTPAPGNSARLLPWGDIPDRTGYPSNTVLGFILGRGDESTRSTPFQGSAASDLPVDGYYTYDWVSDTWTIFPFTGSPTLGQGRWANVPFTPKNTDLFTPSLYFYGSGSGGASSASNFMAADGFYGWNYFTGAWTTLTSPPVTRDQPGLASSTYTGIVPFDDFGFNLTFLVGGIDPGTGLATKTVYAYLQAANLWIARADMPVALYSPTCIVDRHWLYVIGGRTDTGFSDVIYRYDLVGDSWTDTGDRLSVPRANPMVVVHSVNTRSYPLVAYLLIGGVGATVDAAKATDLWEPTRIAAINYMTKSQVRVLNLWNGVNNDPAPIGYDQPGFDDSSWTAPGDPTSWQATGDNSEGIAPWTGPPTAAGAKFLARWTFTIDGVTDATAPETTLRVSIPYLSITGSNAFPNTSPVSANGHLVLGIGLYDTWATLQSVLVPGASNLVAVLAQPGSSNVFPGWGDWGVTGWFSLTIRWVELAEGPVIIIVPPVTVTGRSYAQILG